MILRDKVWGSQSLKGVKFLIYLQEVKFDFSSFFRQGFTKLQLNKYGTKLRIGIVLVH